LRRSGEKQVRISGCIAQANAGEHRPDVFEHEITVQRFASEVQRFIRKLDPFGGIALEARECGPAMQS